MANIIPIIIESAIVIMLLILGIIIIIGKGDKLIAGYEEEKEKYSIGRLRAIMGSLCLLIAGLYVLRCVIGIALFIVITTLIGIIGVVLANTWARR